MLCAIAGVFSWLLAEYWIHRMLGHVIRARTPFRVEHLKHHVEGNYFAPAWKKALSAVVLLPVITLAAALVLPLGQALLFAGGFLSMYLVYELNHWWIHVAPPRSAYGRWIRHHHLVHHFSSANSNHAVSLPLFDRLWGTLRGVAEVRVPRPLAPPWLRDGAGAEWTDHGTTFRVVD